MNEDNQQNIIYHKYRILVVDSDVKCCRIAANYLMEYGFQVVIAESTDSAKEILKTEKIDLVISELRMPQNSGIELAKWIRRVYDTSFRKNMPLPFLIMTGFTHLLQQKDLDNYYIDGCILKPLDAEEMRNSILIALNLYKPSQLVPESNHLNEEKELLADVKEKEYCKILISDFTSFPIVEIDIYVQLSNDKFVQIARKGEQVNDTQFQRYQEKGIEFLYIKKDDFQKIVNFNLKINSAVSKSGQLELNKKKRFMIRTGEIILENTFVNGMNQQAFYDAKEYLCTSIGTLIEDEESFSLLEILSRHSDVLYAHSLGVSIYSVMIAQAMGWSSGANLFKLSFGALIHDIGKKDFDSMLLSKPKSDITNSEKLMLDTHVEKGKEILAKHRFIPSEVIAIVYEHHENAVGNGYPRRLKKNHVSPMAKIVAVADEFCYLAIKNPDFPAMDAEKALKMLEKYKYDLLDSDALGALRRLVKKDTKKRKSA